MSGDFSVFATRSQVGRIAEAVVTLLTADPELKEFFGYPDEVRIFRTSGLVPDRPVPFCVVRPLTEPREHQLNREAEIILPIAIGVCYDEERDILEEGDKSLEDLFNAVAGVLVEDQLLELPLLGGSGALVQGIASFQPLDLIPLRENEDGTIITLFTDLVVNYRYTVDAATGVQA